MLDSLARAAAATQHRELARCRDRERRVPDQPTCAATTADGSVRGSATAVLATSRYAADHAALVQAFVSLAEATGQRRWIAEAVDDGRCDARPLLGPGGRRRVHHRHRRRGARHPARRTCSTTRRRRPTASPRSDSSGSPRSTGDRRYQHHAEQILVLVGSLAATHPLAFPELLSAVDLHRSGATEIAVVGDRPDLVAAVAARATCRTRCSRGASRTSRRSGSRETYGFAYVCRDYACLAPVDTVDGARRPARVERARRFLRAGGRRWRLGRPGRAARARVSLTLATGLAKVDHSSHRDRGAVDGQLGRGSARGLHGRGNELRGS